MTGFDSKRTAALDRLAEVTEELGLYDKPVAWGMRDKDGGIQATITPQQYAKLGHNYNVPLYTTPPAAQPAQEKNT
jgi:hypothetical protein